MPDNPAPTPAPAPMQPNDAEVRKWNMLCHLSALAGFVGVPLGNLLGPFIVWQMKKNEIPSVEIHGKAALNFQLTVLIAALTSGIIGAILLFICIGVVFIVLAGAIGICGLVFAIIAGLKANEGKDYNYPYSLKLIK